MYVYEVTECFILVGTKLKKVAFTPDKKTSDVRPSVRQSLRLSACTATPSRLSVCLSAVCLPVCLSFCSFRPSELISSACLLVQLSRHALETSAEDPIATKTWPLTIIPPSPMHARCMSYWLLLLIHTRTHAHTKAPHMQAYTRTSLVSLLYLTGKSYYYHSYAKGGTY